MIRQIFAEPLIPCQVDFTQRRGMSLIAERGFNQRDDAQVDLGEMRIGAKMIAQDYHAFAFQIAQCLVHDIFAKMISSQSSQQFRCKQRLLAAAAQNLEYSVLRIR